MPELDRMDLSLTGKAAREMAGDLLGSLGK